MRSESPMMEGVEEEEEEELEIPEENKRQLLNGSWRVKSENKNGSAVDLPQSV